MIRHLILLQAACFLWYCSDVVAQWKNGAQWDQNPFWGYSGGQSRVRRDQPCPPDSPWACGWQPPFYPYDQIEVNVKDVGIVIGRSMIYGPHWGHFINVFLGVPYAKAPIGPLRFKKPEDVGPNWDQGFRKWNADEYRPACPQEIWKMEHYYYEARNVTEDCLYLNIFAPNLTFRHSENRNYPVLVFIHGQEYKLGDSMLNPGHILAQREVMVVTFNYRIGALGFMSTTTSDAPGNYGLHDVLHVLKFVQKHIYEFRGDPNKVTLAGAASGASIVGLMLLSPLSVNNGRPLFHQAIMMSGSDLCEWAVNHTQYDATPLEYMKQLGRQVGCDPDHGKPLDTIVECMRYKHYEEIVNASASVYSMYGTLAAPFTPVIDGDVLTGTPQQLRADGKFMKVKIIAGVNKEEGAYLARNITKDMKHLDMEKGLEPHQLDEIIYKFVMSRSPPIRNTREVIGAIKFQYTYWSRPDNKTAVAQNLIDWLSDMYYGWCVDAVLKSHAEFQEPVYMYTFNYRSEYESLPLWMGIPHGRDVNYVLGHPFFNETIGNVTGVVPDQWEWTYLDKNISIFMQEMWANFTKYGQPTTEWQRNVSWFTFSPHNLSYLHIGEYSWMDIHYRQNWYAFWREYFPEVSSRRAIWELTTPQPTPEPLNDYQAATWSLVAIALLLIFIIAALGMTLWRKSKSDPY